MYNRPTLSPSLRTVLTGAAISAWMLAAPAYANESAAGLAESDVDQIIVTGRIDGYRTIDTTSGTKTSTPILDVPQAISVVTADQIADQNLRSMADIVRMIPGVSAGQGEGHRDQITLRGNNSTADFFIDGLRDDAQYYRSFYNIERVEAHKGANAMIFGRGGGGGVINRITKGAALGQTLVRAVASADTWGAWQLSSDVNLPLSDNVAGRLNAYYEHLDNHRPSFSGNHMGINQVIGAQLGGWKVQLGYEYVQDDRVIDRGIPSAVTGSIANPTGPAINLKDTFFGVPGVNEGSVKAHIATFRSSKALADNLDFTTQALWGRYDKIYTNAYAATPVTGGSVGIEAYRDPTLRTSFIGQANLIWKTALAGMEHKILFGAEATQQDTTSERITGFFSPTTPSAANRRATVAITNPMVIPTIYFISGSGGNNNRKVSGDLSQWSVYLQDQIKLGHGFELIGGLRYDRLSNRITNQFTNGLVARTESLWSPRAGLVFKPVPEASIYVSYAKSYLPQSGDQFTTFDATYAALAPETFDNYEAGAKWDIQPGLTATIAVYQLDRGNTRATDPQSLLTVLTGGQRTRGIELGMTGRITPQWQTALGYSLAKAEITRTTTAAPAGRQVGQTPRHTFSLWNRYEATEKLGLGLGIYHQSRSFTSISNTTVIPAYTRIDGAVFYKLSERVEAQVNLENIGGATYFPTAHNDNNITVGAPFSARFTLSFKM